MGTSYKVRVFSIQKRYPQGDLKKTQPSRYVVRWSVDGARFDQSFKKSTQASSFRSDVESAVNRGEAFDVESGPPGIDAPGADREDVPWVDFAAEYCAMRWDELSAGSRRNLVRDLADITAALLPAGRGRPQRALFGRALRLAYNVPDSRRRAPGRQ